MQAASGDPPPDLADCWCLTPCIELLGVEVAKLANLNWRSSINQSINGSLCMLFIRLNSIGGHINVAHLQNVTRFD